MTSAGTEAAEEEAEAEGAAALLARFGAGPESAAAPADGAGASDAGAVERDVPDEGVLLAYF